MRKNDFLRYRIKYGEKLYYLANLIYSFTSSKQCDITINFFFK